MSSRRAEETVVPGDGFATMASIRYKCTGRLVPLELRPTARPFLKALPTNEFLLPGPSVVTPDGASESC
jgi:hypothetical protein